MPRNILLVEDDRNLAAVLSDTLENAGYGVDNAADGPTAIERLRSNPYDLVLLDVILPGESGFAICRKLRGGGIHTPVLILTALNDPAHIVTGLKDGADDYVTKPFDPTILLARIQALLRREDLHRSHHLAHYRFGGVHIDFLKGIAIRDNIRIGLSGKELHLLRYLISRRGNILTRQELLREVWGCSESITRTVDVHIAALRQKLEDQPHHPAFILTVRGEGYLFKG